MPKSNQTVEHALQKLKAVSVPQNRAGMARFGIEIEYALGVSMPNIRRVGNTITKDHMLAQQLWDSKIHEARILASLVDHAKWVTPEQMDDWALDFNSWDLCDQVCGNLFDRTQYVDEKIFAWAKRREEFVKRAAFAMIAWRAVHDKKASDDTFMKYFVLIEDAAHDNRNFVKKAVNWALRQTGKRSKKLYDPAMELAKKLIENDNAAARWVGKDALKELGGDKIRSRLGI